jgi:hypothetical protein
LTERHSKNRDAWLNDLEKRLVQLENEGKIDLKSLLANESFLELVYSIVQEGQATLNFDKHQLLSDVVINYSQNRSMDDDKKYIFLKYIEQFTPSHIALMKLLSEPKPYFAHAGIPWPDLYMGGRTHIINAVFPAWSNEFINLLFEDLKNSGLLQSGSLTTTMSVSGLEQSLATGLGLEFLAFIRSA